MTKKQQEIRQQDVQKQRLVDRYQAGSICLEEIQECLEQIRARIHHLEEEVSLLQREQEQQCRQLQLIEPFEAFQHKLDTNLSALHCEQKNVFVRLFVKGVIVDTIAEEIIIRHTLPLDKNNSSDHSGSSGSSDDETERRISAAPNRP